MSIFQVIRVGGPHDDLLGYQGAKSGERTAVKMCSFSIRLSLLEDEHKIPKKSKLRPGYEKERGSRKHRSCQYTLRFKKGDNPVIRDIRKIFRAI